MYSKRSKVPNTISDRHARSLGEGGRILIDIADLGEIGKAVARHRREGGAVIINGSLHLGPPGDRQHRSGARVVADHVVFVAPPNADPFDAAVGSSFPQEFGQDEDPAGCLASL